MSDQPKQPDETAPPVDLYDLPEETDTSAVPSEPAPAASPAQPSTPPAPSHPKSLVRVARDLGISDAEIKDSSTEELSDMVALENRRLQDELRESRRWEERGRAEARVPVEEKEDLGLDPTQYDPGLVRLLETQAKELKALKAQLRESTERDQQRTNQSNAEQVDDGFEAIGRPDLFGEGAGPDLDQRSEEYQQRLHVIRVAQGIKGGTIKQRIVRAYKSLLALSRPVQEPEPQTDPLKERKEKWDQSGVATPTHRRANEQPGRQKAIKTFERMRAQMNSENGTPDDDDGPL